MSNANFIDYVKVFCRSGKGGAGSAHLHRDKFNPKGGPDGGDGGRGGHVIIRGHNQLWTLLHLKYDRHLVATDGEPGGSSLKTGAGGEDVYIDVPLGTVVRNAETQEQIFEITGHMEQKILFEGGRGGLGNNHFKSATNQTPRYAQPGESGQEGWVVMELKVLADVGLVGFPNAGKSTLLSAVSAARPKIADYPFTTLVPSLGIVKYRENRSYVMADIPGIIEGASEGKGLGHRFLRHIERNAILLFLIPSDSRDVRKDYDILLEELGKYNPELLDKKRMLVITKSDLLDEELTEELRKELPDVPSTFISSVANKGLVRMNDMIWNLLNS
ncbi:MAG: GTPase ObgE [Bacteroidales bacterium]|nr:GTPase ObgE [Bacteroidales bacterium]